VLADPSAPSGSRFGTPALGLGVGLRSEHYGYLLREEPEVDFFEAIAENFLDTGGRPLYVLDHLAERYPVVLHGVSLSIATTDPLDRAYLAKLKRLADRVRAVWVSDHLCWTGVAGRTVHDLLPVPLTEGALAHVIDRVRQVQDLLERPLILENPSSYVQYARDTMSEPEFLVRLCEQAHCGLLLDINNVYVSAFNHGFDALGYLQAIPPEHVAYHHVAGHTHAITHIVDTHVGPVPDPVWELYQAYHAISGGRSTVLEWDEDIPSFEEVRTELHRARTYFFAPHVDGGEHLRSRAEGGMVSASLPSSEPLERLYSMVYDYIVSPLDDPTAWVQAHAEAGLPLDTVRPSASLSGRERLDCYRVQYLVRLGGALEADFVALRAFLGEAAFGQLVMAYLQAHPARSFTLSHLGAHLPGFLAGYPHPRRDFLVALAELEATRARLLDAPEGDELSPEDLTRLSPQTWSGLALKPRSTLQVLELTHPAHAWLEHVLARDSVRPSTRRGRSYLAVYRQDFRLGHVALSRPQYRVLRALCSGQPLARALSAARGVAPELAAGWFADWVQRGFFAAAW
jgi:uncharacterized protein